MARYLVVGSGATGVHFARTMLDRGHTVALIDVGFPRPAAHHPGDDFSALKEHDEADRYFLGEAGEAVVYPAPGSKPYGFPPSKAYVFHRPTGARLEERGFAPLMSYARGGLAEAWTGGSYELRDEELSDFPFAAADLRPHYATVAARIGVTGIDDDLRHHSPLTAGYLDPLPLDAHSAWLLARYHARREGLNEGGFALGRSRVAVLSADLGERQACTNLGRCFWGCPRGALYTPGQTLAELLTHPNFTYHPGFLVRRVLLGPDNRALGVIAEPVGGGSEVEFRSDRVVLAAGALATSQIYLQTLAWQGRGEVALPGLMDNRQAMVPFLSLDRIGAPVALASYQYHMLAMTLDTGDWRRNVHGQISTLKAATVHPIIAALPFDLKTSLTIFRRIRAGLGVVNLWLPDSRRPGNQVRLGQDADGAGRLVLEYGDHAHDQGPMRSAIAATRQALGRLGCVAPGSMVQALPRGSSVHYAGTLPMGEQEVEHTTRRDGSVRGFDGLYAVDGAGFPWLPAKNLTFTLMANATRIADSLD